MSEAMFTRSSPLCVDVISHVGFCLSPSDPLCTRYMEFVCKNRAQCLFQSLVCDGIKHCEDGSDEDSEYAGCGKRHSDRLCLVSAMLNLFVTRRLL